MELLAFINWDFKPEIMEWPLKIVYYGPCWALSFVIGGWLMTKMMKRDDAPEHFAEKLLIYAMVGAVVGARLGHIVFYHPEHYFSAERWPEIFKIWEGGLASHGGALGLVIAILLYNRNISKKSFAWTADKVVITAAIAACLIRVGNLTNSEIIGLKSESKSAFFFEYAAKNRAAKQLMGITDNNFQVTEIDIEPTGEQIEIDGFNYSKGIMVATISYEKTFDESVVTAEANSWANYVKRSYDPIEDHIFTLESEPPKVTQYSAHQAVISVPVMMVPRIPAMLWEGVVYLFIFVFLMLAYWKWDWDKYVGLIFGVFLVLQFTSRFIIEFWKEIQADDLINDAAAPMLNRGQQLSVPAVLIGIYFIYIALKKGKQDTSVVAPIDTKH
ncbi:MAG: phosphatidylglycerol:prolipoprotein diacylglycerol transferase [Flavobacteriales bacterium]|jgi:phosphatidylglycerol:prolipoprotein diacylglycerol transferase